LLDVHLLLALDLDRRHAGLGIDGHGDAVLLTADHDVAVPLEAALLQLLAEKFPHLLGRQDLQDLELGADAVLAVDDPRHALAHPDPISSAHVSTSQRGSLLLLTGSRRQLSYSPRSGPHRVEALDDALGAAVDDVAAAGRRCGNTQAVAGPRRTARRQGPCQPARVLFVAGDELDHLLVL